MSRTSRVPYHQNVYDLLQLEPTECPDAARMIAEHEAAHGPLPASVREWYLVPKMVPLHTSTNWFLLLPTAFMWRDYSINFEPEPLGTVLARFHTPDSSSGRSVVQIAGDEGCMACWRIEPNGTPDPVVWFDYDQSEPEHWTAAGRSFSDFTALAVCSSYPFPYIPLSRNSQGAGSRGIRPVDKPFCNGLWLRTPSEPFEPAVIDYLAEQFDEPERTPRAGNVTTNTFRPHGGIIRVTADEPSLASGLSAWWVHADTPACLAELARLIVPFGTLRETLRADTDPAREVLKAICG